MVKKITKMVPKLLEAAKTRIENMTVDDVITVLTMLPVIGDIVTIAKSGARLFDRVVNGEKEVCYRTGW